MRPRVTRYVYRRLLASHGLLRPGPALAGRCLLLASPESSLLPPPPSSLLARRQPRRTFFGIFQKPPRMLKEPEMEPGYEMLLTFRARVAERSRLPPRDELVQAWRDFVQNKRKNYLSSFNSTQGFLVLHLLQHLAATADESDSNPYADDINLSDLRTVLWLAATRPPKGTTEYHLALAELAAFEIERRTNKMREEGIDEETIKEAAGGKDTANLEMYLTALTQYGSSLRAAKVVDEFHETRAKQDPKLQPRLRIFWTLVLRGLAKEGREEDLLREWKKAEAAGLQYMPPIHEIMTTFFASRNRIPETRQWFTKPTHANWARSPRSYMEAVRFALRNGQQQWLQPIFERLINSNPQKEWWDVIFQWAVLVMNKGVEDIRQMMVVMSSPSKGKEGHKPDAATIDALLTAAIEKQNPYLAERFLSLAAELHIQPKASTYLLQMDYRLDASDFSGVQAIYDKLLKGEVSISQDEDLPVLNKYLRALCAAPDPELGRILDITADLEQRRATLEPDTVVSLCMLFLRNDNRDDVIDTLSLHTALYSVEERTQVRRAFVEYCADRSVSTARVWDAYSLARQFFPEMERAERVRLMDAFYARRRPDMACLIFGHMRALPEQQDRPTKDEYVRVFEGLGPNPDPESLRIVHNMLKMDMTIQMDTRLYNALMIAYAACEEPRVAIGFWRDITNSAEGPSYASLAIVFWACELQPYGDRTARGIWQKVLSMDLEVPEDVFWAYCGALAGNDHLEEVKRLIKGMEQSVGYGPGFMM